MSDQELYNHIQNTMYESGSCKFDEWHLIEINKDNKKAAFEAINPSKGNIRIRRPVKKYGVNGYDEQVYFYEVFRFTNKQELKFDGFMEDVRVREYANKTV